MGDMDMVMDMDMGEGEAEAEGEADMEEEAGVGVGVEVVEAVDQVKKDVEPLANLLKDLQQGPVKLLLVIYKIFK
jgi:hypothetical protein